MLHWVNRRAWLFGALVGTALPAHGEERASYPLRPQDWLEGDRRRFQALSSQLSGESLMNAMPLVLTFANAATANTQDGRADEYRTIEQRNAYYNLISLVLEYDRNTPVPLKEVRFFHAATLVTIWTQVGAADLIKNFACIDLSTETRDFFREVNRRLFGHNMPIVRNLMFQWREPRDPVTPVARIAAWDFDVAMVRSEQAQVERAISELSPAAQVRTQINGLNDCVLTWLGADPITRAAQTMVEATIGKPDFFNTRHRRAIGYALITIFHRRPQADFRALVAAES